MNSNGIGIGLIPGYARRRNKGSGGGTPVLVKRLAHRVYGPGHSTGSALPVGDGTQKTYSSNFVNESGTSISVCSVVLQGWSLSTSGTLSAATFSVSGTIEFPVGTPVGTITSTSVVSGTNVVSADVTLSAPITVGGTFKINLASTPTNGQTYVSNLGFAGLRNHAMSNLQKKVATAGFGDSLMTNNSGPLFNASLGRCGSYLNSISGTTAATYGITSAANFQKQADVAALLGCTHVLMNFCTNDAFAGDPVATTQGYLNNIRDLVRTKGMKSVMLTMLPRTGSSTKPVTLATSSGKNMFVTVADGTQFHVGSSYVIAGAAQSEYNTFGICTAINTNILTILFTGSGTPTATGSLTISSQTPTSELEFQVPLAAYYNPGSGSNRGVFNAWIRAGNFDDYVDWSDNCEHSRDSGTWKVHGDSAFLPETQLVTVSSVVGANRFISNYNRGDSTIANGYVLGATGLNAGVIRFGNGNSGGDITVTSNWGNTPVIGDTYWCWPGTYMSDDGTHPRQSVGNKGGSPHLDQAIAVWLDARLA